MPENAPKRLLILSPTPECLCLAAYCRDAWTDIEAGGQFLIQQVLESCRRTPPPYDEIIAFVYLLSEPEQVADGLANLIRQGKTVTLYAPEDSESVREVARRVPQVQVQTGATILEAGKRVFAGRPNVENLLEDVAERHPDLLDYLEYKISLFFMTEMDKSVLREAIDRLTELPGRSFSLYNLPPDERGAADAFRTADSPFIEGQTDTMMRLKRRIRQVAATDLSALLIGETGTGKELAAFYLHAFGPRKSSPFLALNCAGLREEMMRSELFGHVKGAFTGAVQDKIGLVEAASGGTLFLDEIVDMPLSIQADLLRFLQTRRFRAVGGTVEKKADIRIVAAAQPLLRERLRSGAFRKDLYYRIAGVTIYTPPLRQVPDDIRRVIRHLVHRHESIQPDLQVRQAVYQYFCDHLEFLRSYPWPGNTRELANLVRRRVVLGDDVVEELQAQSDLAGSPNPLEEGVLWQNLQSPGQILPLEELASQYVQTIHRLRDKWGITQKETAERLGIAVNTYKRYLGNDPDDEQG